jgi:hypothetical protein
LASELEIDLHPYGAAQHRRYRRNPPRGKPRGGFNPVDLSFNLEYVCNVSSLTDQCGTRMRNPFKYGGIVTGPYFADRAEEIKALRREIENL